VGEVESPRELPNTAPPVPPRRRTPAGQAVAEFSIVSVAFFMLVFGTIDFGRAIYMYAQLRDAAREGARYGTIYPDDVTTIKSTVIGNATGFDLGPSDVSVTCKGGCTAESTAVTVVVTGRFTAITQNVLGLSPITMSASATAGTD
jgi:Flp pilus assembly protein TadG